MTHYKESFHNHTFYCDGKNSPEEMVKAAIDKNFTALGLSGHAYIKDLFCGWCMTPEKTAEYLKEIEILKQKYQGKINLYAGTELDYYCTDVPGEYQFKIGSVHLVKKEGNYLEVDHNCETTLKNIRQYYNGDSIGFAVDYYKLVADVLNKLDADIIGHFDLVTKFNEKEYIIDTDDKRYINAWHDAVDALIPYNKPFEINTGAVAKGLRTIPYPALDIADYIHSKGGFFVLNSDCHNADYIDCFFDESLKMYSKYNIISFEKFLTENKKESII